LTEKPPISTFKKKKKKKHKLPIQNVADQKKCNPIAIWSKRRYDKRIPQIPVKRHAWYSPASSSASYPFFSSLSLSLML
jgi:hypothetical protein